MTSEELVQTLFPSKKEKLQFILDWIDKNCDQHQKEEVSQLLSEYSDIMITFPNQEFMRCSHALSSIETPPSKQQVVNMPKTKAVEHINQELETRKQIINGLLMEIEELKHVKHEVQDNAKTS